VGKFTLVVTPKSDAARAVAQLQPPIRRQFWEAMDLLCENPVAHSKQVRFMSVRAQAYRFKVEIDPSVFYFTVIFRFADTVDENTLIVYDILIKEV
jgi:hypothetical protein